MPTASKTAEPIRASVHELHPPCSATAALAWLCSFRARVKRPQSHAGGVLVDKCLQDTKLPCRLVSLCGAQRARRLFFSVVERLGACLSRRRSKWPVPFFLLLWGKHTHADAGRAWEEKKRKKKITGERTMRHSMDTASAHGHTFSDNS